MNPYLCLLTVLLIALKLAGHIATPWVLVISPIWLPIAAPMVARAAMKVLLAVGVIVLALVGLIALGAAAARERVAR